MPILAVPVPEGVERKEYEDKLRLSASFLVYSCRRLLKQNGIRVAASQVLHLIWPNRLNSFWEGAVLEATRIGYVGMRKDNTLTMDVPSGDLAIYMARERTSITTVRLPKDLKRWVHAYCKDHGISFTRLVIHLLTELRRQRGGEVKVEDI